MAPEGSPGEPRSGETGHAALRVVGFKVLDPTSSPTSVFEGGEPQPQHGQHLLVDSPRSQLAEALRRETFHPLPSLRIKTLGKRHGLLGMKKSHSHVDLTRHVREGFRLGERGDGPPQTPDSRTSASSTPLEIPSR